MGRLLIICFLFLTTQTFSQKKEKLPSTDTDFKKYLDDGRRDLRKNALKLQLDGILNTEITCALDRKLSPAWSVETGVGIIPHYIGLNEMFNGIGGFDGDSLLLPKGVGFSYQVMQKFYYTWGAIDQGGYWGLMFKQRNFKNPQGNKITYREWAMMWGVQYLLKKSFCLDLGYGFGTATYTVEKATVDSKGNFAPYSQFMVTQHLRLGIGVFIGREPLKDAVSRSKKSKKGGKDDE